MTTPADTVQATYEPEDFEPWEGPPERSFVICASARSGSSLLGQLLTDTGVLGAPVEYLNPARRDLLAARWGCGSSRRAYVDALHRHRVSANGIFGVKVLWHQLVAWQDELRGAPGDPAAVDAACLGALVSEPRFLRIVRRDLAAQAVSFYIALQTHAWSRLPGAGEREPAPPYDFDAIDACVRFLAAEELAWERFLRFNGLEALTVEYEQLARDPGTTIRIIARALDAGPVEDVPAARLAILRTPTTDTYAERYREDAAARGRGTSEWLSRVLFEAGLRRDAEDGGLQRLADLGEAYDRLSIEVARLRERERLLDAILNEDQ